MNLTLRERDVIVTNIKSLKLFHAEAKQGVLVAMTCSLGSNVERPLLREIHVQERS